MKSKTKKILVRVVSVLVVMVIGVGALCKLAGLPALIEIYSKMGLLQYLQVLGVVELILLGVFLWPRTMKTGFLLLTGYFGGAMAVELSHGTLFIAPACILCLVWISAYLRDASVFQTPQQPRAISRSAPLHTTKHKTAS